ncbi:hypothetical protein ACVIHD_005993 [Bradyrhizobium embrapense]
MSVLKLFELPHVSIYRRRWVRRVMIVLTIPQEVARAVMGTLRAAAFWRKQPQSTQS